jgi:putative endonuclease
MNQRYLADQRTRKHAMYLVYILQCADGYYYTDVTNNLVKRVNEHNAGLIEGYTLKRLPVQLVYNQSFQFIDDAIKAEKKIKGWSRKKKEALIRGDFNNLVLLSKSKVRKGDPSTGSG